MAGNENDPIYIRRREREDGGGGLTKEGERKRGIGNQMMIS